ncbi:hypothetical protein DM48_7439 [Burkholderia gladioli]|uniref:Uncharacterized protein n=1 Tax=Burkholderia gladioli TaxID=28095 RepID=A0AAW3ETP1_BURGA|nr:hypothetical protein DM48_7439 [Burkholderia gladioli]
MSDGRHVGTPAIGFGMEKAFDIDGATVGIDRFTVVIVQDDVAPRDSRRRHRTGKQKKSVAFGMSDADMPKAIDYALIGQNVIGGNQQIDSFVYAHTHECLLCTFETSPSSPLVDQIQAGTEAGSSPQPMSVACWSCP